jgi:CheY-like chemotaxis protein
MGARGWTVEGGMMTDPERQILIVEDDPEITWALGLVLLREGFSVTTCADGEEAISILASRAFDFVITDIALPRGSGLAITDWVRKHRPGLRVVVMTALGSPMMKELSLLKGAIYYLEKPIDPHLFLEILSGPDKSKAFCGAIHDVGLLDYLQLLILSGKQVLLEILATNGESGQIFIDAGEVLHATCGELIGEEAFFRCVGFEGGRFENLNWQPPEKITINKPGQFLLFESARRKDES